VYKRNDAMYHIVIEQQAKGMELPEIEESDNDYLAALAKQPMDAECVAVSTSNPRVEHIHWHHVHLYQAQYGSVSAQAALPWHLCQDGTCD